MSEPQEGFVNIDRMHVVESENQPRFCFITVAKTKIWLVGIFFDQVSALEYIKSLKQFVVFSRLREFSDMLRISDLPLVCEEKPIMIPYYAGLMLARATNCYLSAMQQRFNPYTNWPVINRIPEYDFFVFTANKNQYHPVQESNAFAYNGLLGYYDFQHKPILHMLNSREQWDDCLSKATDLTDQQIVSINHILNESRIPETSEAEPMMFTDLLAKHMFEVLRYHLYIYAVLEVYEDCRWGSGAKNFNYLVN
ncbi:MAG TPA: hypothetical protein VHQ41_01155 [Patescibacteria group bacterium]|jgi:hypothetical protein|nr:hypothetical protein [Patescibacteria group bacterium]